MTAIGAKQSPLIAEDEATQRELLVDYLARQNFRVSGVDGGAALRPLIERDLPALVMLDVGLPGEDGFALARWLRERSGRVGIIMVTAATDTVDRVVGLETGADDYIAKPFEPRELLARVKSVLRRVAGSAATPGGGSRVRMGRRLLDLEKRVLVDVANGTEEALAASEFDLLKVFAENPNRPLMRDWLLEVTAHRDTEAFDRAIDLRITRLRRKIERDPADRGGGELRRPWRHSQRCSGPRPHRAHLPQRRARRLADARHERTRDRHHRLRGDRWRRQHRHLHPHRPHRTRGGGNHHALNQRGPAVTRQHPRRAIRPKSVIHSARLCVQFP